MARDGYVKQVWEDGVSPVNAERLNEMERGIALGVNLAQEALDNAGGSGSGVFIISVAIGESGPVVDKTFAELRDAVKGGDEVVMLLAMAEDVVKQLHMTDFNVDIASFGGIRYMAYSGGVTTEGMLVTYAEDGSLNLIQIPTE